MLKEISVSVNDIEHHPLALVSACKFAIQHGGRVTASYFKPELSNMIRSLGTDSAEVIEQAILGVDERHDRTRKHFETLTDTFDVPKVWRSVSGTLNPIKQMICTDVIFVNQITDEEHAVTKNSLISRLILETKRPVIMIPDCWTSEHFGRQILLGWDNSPEAMRAVQGALPLLEKSTYLRILDILDGRIQGDEYTGLKHIEEYLTHKKVVGQLIFDDADQLNKVPRLLANHSNSGEFDLLVVGAYGHTKEGEIVMDGVTNHLISNSEIPVLFSH